MRSSYSFPHSFGEYGRSRRHRSNPGWLQFPQVLLRACVSRCLRTFSLKCGQCFRELQRSRPRGAEYALFVIGMRPFRCHSCQARQYRMRLGSRRAECSAAERSSAAETLS